MLGFEVWRNGERLGVCGDGALGSLHAIVGCVAKREELTLNVIGVWSTIINVPLALLTEY